MELVYRTHLHPWSDVRSQKSIKDILLKNLERHCRFWSELIESLNSAQI